MLNLAIIFLISFFLFLKGFKDDYKLQEKLEYLNFLILALSSILVISIFGDIFWFSQSLGIILIKVVLIVFSWINYNRKRRVTQFLRTYYNGLYLLVGFWGILQSMLTFAFLELVS